jgi:hypothetical protein
LLAGFFRPVRFHLGVEGERRYRNPSASITGRSTRPVTSNP